LSGLQAALERQGRGADAQAVKARLTDVWKQADIRVVAGRPVSGGVPTNR
jgi:hypothetical protein